jgi:hypothetical protein
MRSILLLSLSINAALTRIKRPSIAGNMAERMALAKWTAWNTSHLEDPNSLFRPIQAPAHRHNIWTFLTLGPLETWVCSARCTDVEPCSDASVDGAKSSTNVDIGVDSRLNVYGFLQAVVKTTDVITFGNLSHELSIYRAKYDFGNDFEGLVGAGL